MNAVPQPPNAATVAAVRARVITRHPIRKPQALRRYPGAQRIGHALESDFALHILFTEMPLSNLSRTDIEDMYNHALASIYAGSGLRTNYQLHDRWQNRNKAGRRHPNWNVVTRANTALSPAQLTVKQNVLNDLCTAANLMSIVIHPNESQLQGVPAPAGNQPNAIPGATAPQAQQGNPQQNANAGGVVPQVQQGNQQQNAISDAAAPQAQQGNQPQNGIAGALRQDPRIRRIDVLDNAGLPNVIAPANLHPPGYQFPVFLNLQQPTIQRGNVNDVAQPHDGPDIEMEDAFEPAINNDFQMPRVELRDYAGLPANHLAQRDDLVDAVRNHEVLQNVIGTSTQHERLDRVNVSLRAPPQPCLFDADNNPQGYYANHGLTLSQASDALGNMFTFLTHNEAELVLTEHSGDIGEAFRELDSQYGRLTTWTDAVQTLLNAYR